MKKFGYVIGFLELLYIAYNTYFPALQFLSQADVYMKTNLPYFTYTALPIIDKFTQIILFHHTPNCNNSN